MKKLLTAMMISLMLVAFGVATAEAADAPIAVTVTVTKTIAVSVDKATWTIGEVAGDVTGITTQVYPTGVPLGTITATNNGNGLATLTIDVDATTGEGWTFADAVGIDEFAMTYSLDAYVTSGTSIPVSGSATLNASLGAGADQGFDIELLLPSSTTVGGTAQSFNVTVTAS